MKRTYFLVSRPMLENNSTAAMVGDFMDFMPAISVLVDGSPVTCFGVLRSQCVLQVGLQDEAGLVPADKTERDLIRLYGEASRHFTLAEAVKECASADEWCGLWYEMRKAIEFDKESTIKVAAALGWE